ncbi:magnesium/cobalt efflux protein [Gammaproteobacteria bacterium ESL0073]|uniref:Magnesium and cobalt efflux protein CorC n=1 Tax=Entomomonas moraniae TaxID=2213226 RepID=A0A3Q9JM72_9GAMM|nr:CBS domain-containing protein [Entomomonas moraniae]AWM79143.1 magnesium/cobalt efflux protein [Gammaproteobacteria bacterium ESL0073]AZS51220.1 CBS domain-containing protein [Entomomonas moraniae]
MSEDPSSHNKSWFEKITHVFAHHEPKSRQDLLEFLYEAHANKLLDTDALTIVESAIQIADLQVRDIMLSRSQMVSIKITQPLLEFLPVIIKTAHSRYPVLEEDNETIAGILLVKDLLPYLLKLASEQEPEFDIRSLLRPATYVPESKRVNVLLREFRATHNHMAIIVDEYGGVAGLVTIEDVLEQIVGDIEDEHDIEEESYIRPQPNGDFVVKAQTPIHVFNHYFPENRYSEEFGKTIGELVLHHFGYLPKRNETKVIGAFTYRVLTADSRRLHLLRLTPSKIIE